AIIQSESHESERRCSRFAFAVPGVVVQKIVKALKTGISPTFPKLGIRMTVVKVGNQWRVSVAKAKGPARQAGVRKDDILLSVNDQLITSAAQLKSYLLEHTKPGQSIELRVLRDEIEKTMKVTLGEA
ncbi:MAG: PDZ domain-containing protein, partial [Nitrospirales bacterium]